MGDVSSQEQRLMEERIRKSTLPRPFYVLTDKLLRFLAKTKLGDAIAQRNPLINRQIEVLEEQISVGVNEVGEFTSTVNDMLDGLFYASRGENEKAERAFLNAIRARSPFIRYLGSNKGVFLCGEELLQGLQTMFSRLGSNPGWYELEPEQTALFHEVSFELERAGYRVLKSEAIGMKRIVLVQGVDFLTAEEYAMKRPESLKIIREHVSSIDGWMQRNLQHVPRKTYALRDKINASLESSEITLSSNGAATLDTIVQFHATNSQAIFTDRSLANHFVDVVGADWQENIIVIDFETLWDRTTAGHAFMDYAFKTNLKLPSDIDGFRKEWYAQTGFHEDADKSRLEEFVRFIRLRSQFSTKFPYGMDAASRYVSQRLGEDLGSSMDDCVNFINRRGAQLMRLAQ